MTKSKTLLIDGHVHIYPQYKLLQAVRNGINNLKNATEKSLDSHPIEEGNDSGEFTPIWLLTERSDCNFFDQVIKSPAKFKNDGLKFLPGDEKETVIVELDGRPILYILAGRQIVTKERLEILSLTSTLFPKDKEKSTNDVIKYVIDSGGIAVLNWAPGKWFFSRGKVVKRILEQYSCENLVIGDTSLRNTLWPVPKLMKRARNLGFKIIAGSDPLPFEGEEKFIGSYGFSLRGKFNPERPADSVRSLLKLSENNVSLIGKRNNVVTFCQRQYKIMADKRLEYEERP